MTALAHKREESTNMATNPLPACSTEGGRPEAAVMRGLKAIVRPVARVVVLAHLALALQPLSAIAQPAGQMPVSPTAQAELRRYQMLDEKIRQAQQQGQSNTFADLLPQHLQRAKQLARDLQATPNNKAMALQDQGRQALWDELQRTLQAIRLASASEQGSMAAMGEQLRQEGAASVIVQRQAQAEQQLSERMAQFERIAAPLLAQSSYTMAPHPAPALAALEQFAGENTPYKNHTPLDPHNLPWNAAKPTPRMPAETQAEWLQRLPAQGKSAKNSAKNNVKNGPAGLTTIAGLQFTHPPAPEQAPTEADLAETIDIQLSPLIRAQAAALGHNPVAIAQWVRNNIHWIPTWGSVQGAELTMLNERGNAIDIASLTIALLRASGIPARYMLGTIEIDAWRMQNWIGDAPSPQVALGLMQQGGIAAQGVLSGGKITKIRMEHAWVQAYVNWGASRGALQGGNSTEPEIDYAGLLQHPNPNASLNAWVGIDTSYKQYIFSKPLDFSAAIPPLDVASIQQTIASNINTAEGYINGFNESPVQLELKRYASQVNAYLETIPDLKLGDLVKFREVISDMKQLLSGHPPFPVLASQETAELPNGLRHGIIIKLFSTNFDRAQDNHAFIWESSLPALGIKRLGITHAPASAADEQTLEGIYRDGATSIPTYLLGMKPLLQIDGMAVASGPAMRAGNGQFWSITLTDPSGINTRTSLSDTTVGDEIVLGINGNGISGNAVAHQLINSHPDTAAGNLEQGALHYWMEHDAFDQMIADRLGILTQRMPSVAVVSAPLSVRWSFGVPRSGTYKSRTIDAIQVMLAAAAPTLESRRLFMLYAGIQGSTIEGSVFDQLFSRPEETSVSATQILAIAARAGLRIYSIIQENAGAVVPRLGSSEGVKQDIMNAVSHGMVAYIPERDITHGDYTGTGYLLLNPDTGEGAYLLDGGSNGGHQPDCAGGGAKPPAFDISASTILNWESLAPALLGFFIPGAGTELERQAQKSAAELIARVAKPAAQRIAAQAGPRLAVALAVPGANIIMGVALAVAISIEIYMVVIAIKMILAELEIQQKTRTDEDTCECQKNPEKPQCKKCEKTPVDKRPKWPTSPFKSIYERRVDWHHQCADNSGNSYKGNDVRIIDKAGNSITVDLFDNSRNMACEVKTSFKNEPYSPHVMRKWRDHIATQVANQRKITEACGWSHCIIVNKQWQADALGNLETHIILIPQCGSKHFEPDPYEQPSLELD